MQIHHIFQRPNLLSPRHSGAMQIKIQNDSPPEAIPVNHAAGSPASSHIARSCTAERPDSGYFYLIANNYWSSTEYNSTNAYKLNFNNGNRNNNNKGNNNYVRCVRRL
jgi:hypothetical protein